MSRSLLGKFFSCFLFLSLFWGNCFFLVTPLYAGTIALAPQNKEVLLSLHEGKLTVSGRLALRNEGSDVAYDVVPIFEICGVTWKGAAKAMPAGEWSDWTFSEVGSRADADSGETSSDELAECNAPGAMVPGFWTVVYKDANGYNFSTVFLDEFVIPGVASSASVSFADLPIFASVNKESNGKFRVSVDLGSRVERELLVSLRLYLPLELRADDEQVEVLLKKRERAHAELYLENFSGTLGSTYIGYVIASWGERAERRFSYATVSVPISADSGEGNDLVYYIAGSIVLFSVVVLLFLLRQPESAV